jgi:hypothetical protein
MPSRRSASAVARGRQGHELGEAVAVLHLPQPGQHIVPARHLVELVGHQQHRLALHGFALQQGQHLGVGQVEAAGFDDEQHHVHVTQRRQHRCG